jgi:5-methylcytosine-specific restriction endonuclease McrA
VIRLVQYVRVPQPSSERSLAGRSFARDELELRLLRHERRRLTLDHVVPARRGGDSVWENVVTACAPCNLKKGDRLPRRRR